MLRKLAPRFSLAAASAPQLTRSPEEVEKIANSLRLSTARQKRHEPDPVMADALKRAEGRFAESNERVFADYRMEHGL